MTVVLVVEMSINQVVYVIAVWNGFVATIGAVDVVV